MVTALLLVALSLVIIFSPGIVLSLIAPFLFALMSLPNLLVILVKNYNVHSFRKTVNRYSMQSAVNVDKFGNNNLSPLLNAFLIKNDGYRFGDPQETISSVLGRNQFSKTLTVIGKIIVVLLYVIDVQYWFKGGHCLNSIK